MKTHFVISAAAASICLTSCATDPTLAQKKKSTSIGRFGVTHTTPVDPQAPAPAPAPAPVTENVVSTTPAPAPETAPAPAPVPVKKNIFEGWGKKKEQKVEEIAAAPAPVEKSVPAPAPAPEATPAPAPPQKKNIFEGWGKKKEQKVEEIAAAPAPTPAPAQAAAPAPAPQKKQLFNWNPKKKAEETVATPPAPAPAPVQEAAPAPAPQKKNIFAGWGKKKDEQAASPPQQEQTASAPSKKKNVSIGRFGVTYKDSNDQVAAAPAPAQEAAPEKKRFSWFKRKNDTEGAPVAVKIDEKPVEKAEKKEKSAPKQRVAKNEEPAEFKERQKSGGLSGDIRLPNMLDLPDGKDLKSSGSGTKKTGKEGAVISRPPVEEKKD